VGALRQQSTRGCLTQNLSYRACTHNMKCDEGSVLAFARTLWDRPLARFAVLCLFQSVGLGPLSGPAAPAHEV